jgi:hypothetical protein
MPLPALRSAGHDSVAACLVVTIPTRLGKNGTFHQARQGERYRDRLVLPPLSMVISSAEKPQTLGPGLLLYGRR